jgi:chloramphenicol-sensitive protein RarD
VTREKTKGVWYAAAAFALWGVLPLYWKALKSVPSPQILAHRILWSSAYVVAILAAQKKLPEIGAVFSTWRQRAFILASAITIGVNWFIYIWAVNTDHVVETSLGYFINPIVSILLGTIFLKERLSTWQYVAVGLVVAAVLLMTARLGRLPWIALALAASFGLYGLLRKTSHADSLVGLVLETLILAPACLAYVILQTAGGKGAFGSAPLAVHALLVCSGAVTATPLLWFAHGARRIPLSMLGFIQYLAPSLQLALGVFVFKEPFTATHLAGFSLIWCAVVVYTLTHTPLLGSETPGGRAEGSAAGAGKFGGK